MVYPDIFEESKVFNVKDLYKEANKGTPEPLLSDYAGDFWAEYLEGFSQYDRYFRTKYASFFPYAQDYGETVGEVLDNFQADVKAILTANEKRLSELYRIHVIDDDDYSLVNNYDMHETVTDSGSRSGSNVKGQQINSVNDSTQYGSQTITEDQSTQYGQQKIDDDTETVFGQQTITEDVENVTGAASSTKTDSTSAYNASGYTPVDKSEITDAQRTDTVDKDITNGQHTDTTNRDITNGQHTDVIDNDKVLGQHTDTLTGTHTEGSRTDTSSETTSGSHLTHRYGNIGVMTIDDMLMKHIETWSSFNFYDYVFTLISLELLRGC